MNYLYTYLIIFVFMSFFYFVQLKSMKYEGCTFILNIEVITYINCVINIYKIDPKMKIEGSSGEFFLKG